jgi:hypothetical protein
MKQKPTLILFLILLLSSQIISAQEIISIKKLNGQVNFDGIPDELFWEAGNKFDLIMHSPNFLGECSEESKVYVAYDNNYLWIGAYLNYHDPKKIVSTSKKRDEESKNPDSFGIILDTYNDNENALAFFTMPAGQRIDYAVSNDAQVVGGFSGSKNINFSWNTFWDVKTSQTENGWTVEMRIPFSSLRFQVSDNIVHMGMIINRSISHCNETYTFPEIDPKYGRYAPQKPSLATNIQFEGIKDSKPVYVSPYVITGIDENWNLNDAGNAYRSSKNETFNGGLDVKYSITSNLTMDLTVNTDFAQVEADDEMVNLTRYSLFYPEKRMFFQERSSIFSFSLNGPSQLFYSRRIGINNGMAVPILGGARLTGRVGKWDMGFMDMQTREKNDIDGENFGVLRFRRQVINQNSYVGVIMTSRIGMDADNSFSYGVDGIFRIFGDDYVQVNLAQTTDSLGNNFSTSINPSFYSLKWERRNDKGFAYSSSYYYTGKDFNPQSGFMSQFGMKGASFKLQYGWIPGSTSKLFSYNIDFSVLQTNRVTDNGIESGMYGPGLTFVTKRGWTGKIDLNYSIQGVSRSFFLDKNVDVPAGEYHYYNTRMNFSTPMSKPVAMELMLSAGEFYDGNNFTATLEPIYNISGSVQLSGYYNFNRVVFDVRNQEMNAHIGRVKLLYMYNTKLSVSSFVQYNSLNNITVANFRLRFNPKEGNDLYLVYNETRPTSGYFSEGISPVGFLNRSFQIKYIHTFRM